MKSKIEKLILMIGKRPHTAAQIRSKTGIVNVSAAIYDCKRSRGLRVYASHKVIKGVRTKAWSL